jgi:hypothetical protein
MDQRVFGPYYGTPPETNPDPTRTQTVFQQPIRPARTRLRLRLLTGRRRRTRP